MGIFDKRVEYKPFEYPEVLEYIEMINKSFWVHSEVDFTADIQDFRTKLTPQEQNAVKNALLAIAQIEVSVKLFWGNLYSHLPKPEFNGLGSTFAECEWRHSEAYSRLLTVLGYEDEFKEFVKIPLIEERIKMFGEYLNSDDITSKMFYFTIITENVSLFTQFGTILALMRFKGLMKNVANMIAWTSIDEQIHANAGIWILNQIRRENPELTTLDQTFAAELTAIIEKEDKLVDFIFEAGELSHFTKQDMKNFMRYRVDKSMEALKMPAVFHITHDQYKPMAWFEEEVFAGSQDDFFAKRPVDYTKHDKSITAKDLF